MERSLHGVALLGGQPSHVGGQCGRASLPSVPAYSLQPPNEGTRPSARRCLVLSLQWAWHLLGDVKPPGHRYLMES
jgi:hypothetical protein